MVFAALMAAAAAAPAKDAPAKPELRLEVQPGDIVLDMTTGLTGRLRVLAHNSSSTEVTGKLNFIAPSGLTAKAVESPSLPAAGDLSWLVEVTATESLPSPAKLVIEFAYTLRTGSTPTIAATVATITLAPPQSLVGSIKATLAPAEGSVDELKPFDLRLQIDNPTRRTIEIGPITTLAPPPSYIDLKPGQHTTTIAPGSSIGIPLQVTAKAAIPGTYALLVGFNVRFLNPPGAWEPMTSQGKVTIGIPGITDALQFLGIPSLLLLPGVLMILTFLTVLPWLTQWPEIDWKKPALLLLAVLLSFGAAYAYPTATQRWGGLARDYLRGYELRDVIYVWVGSMAIGLGAVVAVSILYWIGRGVRWVIARQNEPQPGDQPLDILKKLRRHRKAFKLAPRRPTGDPHAAWKLALPFGETDAQFWLVQQAQISPGAAATAGARGTRIQEWLEAIDNAMPDAIDGLIKEIETGLSNEELSSEVGFRCDTGPAPGQHSRLRRRRRLRAANDRALRPIIELALTPALSWATSAVARAHRFLRSRQDRPGTTALRCRRPVEAAAPEAPRA